MAINLTIPWDEVTAKYGSVTSNNAQAMIASGVSPTLIRELDQWTGAVHFEYSLPSGIDVNPTIQNVNPFTEAARNYQDPIQVAYQKSIEEISALNRTSTVGITPPSVPPATQTKPETKGDSTAKVTIMEQVKQAALGATGRTLLNWDEWNYFWKQITGEDGPAPEDRGLTRTAEGMVLLDGKSTYPFETWYARAILQRRPGGVDDGGRTNGNGTGNGAAETDWGKQLAALAFALADAIKDMMPGTNEAEKLYNARLFASVAIMGGGLFFAKETWLKLAAAVAGGAGFAQAQKEKPAAAA